MTDARECAPEDRTKDGWHELRHKTGFSQLAEWRAVSGQWLSGGIHLSITAIGALGYTYLSPVTPAAEVDALLAALARKDAALQDIGRQSLTSEQSPEDKRGADYEFAYDCIIHRARAALGEGGREAGVADESKEAVAVVKRWMVKRGYSTGGGDNIGYLLANLESQMWERVRSAAAHQREGEGNG